MNASRFIFLIGVLSVELIQISIASVVSAGDFNRDFFVTWSPSHVNTSADGRARSLKLDPESGNIYFANIQKIKEQFSTVIIQYVR